MYTIRNIDMKTAPPQFCLQCKKAVIPVAGFSVEVTDEHGTLVGYLHPQGTCKAEWEDAHES
jgi:hypothetical protein